MGPGNLLGAPPGWRPTEDAERYRSIDTLRGLALFGVLMVNLLTIFRLPLLESILGGGAQLGWADRLVEALSNGLLEFKAITIFSFLFGVGLAIQVERVAAKGARPRFRFGPAEWLWRPLSYGRQQRWLANPADESAPFREGT